MMTKTSTPQVTIHNLETGEIITRDANDEELAQMEADKTAQELANAAASQKAADRAALLAQLGITEEQAKLLLG
jgi:hypothetical protein